MLRSKRGRWVLVGLACVAVLIVGLLAQGFLSSPAPAVSVPGVAGGGANSTPPPNPLSSGSTNKPHNGGTGTDVVGNPVQRLRNLLPNDNPLNHLRGGQLHDVTISVSTPGHIQVLGYLVPTGMGSSYGQVHTDHKTWSLHEQAAGSGYLAAIFIQSDKFGSPLTCSVAVDGKVTNTETTSGSYGRAVCLG